MLKREEAIHRLLEVIVDLELQLGDWDKREEETDEMVKKLKKVAEFLES